MSALSEEFAAHLRSGVTTLCRCWAIARSDGVVHGFTDHDAVLEFDGISFQAATGLTATALAQSTGLSVDNAEALGALSDASISETDITAGRFDGAEVSSWLVNWRDPAQRWLQFRGNIGEIRQGGGAFTAELRGLTDRLNRPVGRVYQTPCAAVLGDARCGVDLDAPEHSVELPVETVDDLRLFSWSALPGFDPAWFERGRLTVLTGAAQGLWGTIKRDEVSGGDRRIALWEPLRGDVLPGDRVRLVVGCDKRFATCGTKFSNGLNFQGFPDIPGEDWMVAVPRSTGANTGGSRR